MTDELRRRLHEAERLPYGPTRSANIESIAAQADTLDDVDLALAARLERGLPTAKPQLTALLATAAANIVGSVVFGVAAAWLGQWIGEQL